MLSGNALVSGQYAWTGNTGSRHSGVAYAEQYNRARHYSSITCQWTTRDPLWPMEHPYGYVVGSPVNWLDSSGHKPVSGCCKRESKTYIGPAFGGSVGTVHVHWYWSHEGANCKRMIAAMSKCGISENAVCDILSSGCAEQAKSFGVDPTILCGAMIAEHGGKDGEGIGETMENGIIRSGITDFMIDGICRKKGEPVQGWSTGCISLSPQHARECLEKLKKCNPSLYNSQFGGSIPPNYPHGWIRKIASDCNWSLKVAAACMYVNTKCGNNTEKPMEWPKTWNPGAFPKGWPDNPGSSWYSQHVACAIRAFHQNNIFR